MIYPHYLLPFKAQLSGREESLAPEKSKSCLQLLHNSENLTDNCSAALSTGFLQQQAEGWELRNFSSLKKPTADVQRALYSLLRTTLLLNARVASVSSVNTQNMMQKFNNPREKVVECWWVFTLPLKRITWNYEHYLSTLARTGKDLSWWTVDMYVSYISLHWIRKGTVCIIISPMI